MRKRDPEENPAATAGASIAHDPLPEPPPRPDLGDCCGSGCDPCIFDLYERAMDEYRRRLRDWNVRHGSAMPARD